MQELKFIRFVEFFLENPYKEVYIRELAKKLNLSPFAVKKYADILIEQGFVIDEKKANLRYLKANTSSLFYKHAKISHNIRKLVNSGLIEYIKEEIVNLSSIVLFGSVAKGEDDFESDVDIIVIGKQKHLGLGKFEEEVNKEITIHFFTWNEWNQMAKKKDPFYYEVITSGISLYKELPIVQI